MLVRVLMDDDPAQTAVARRVIGQGVFVPNTVLLELGWVLRSYYALKRADLSIAVRRLLAIDFIHFEDRAAVEAALTLHDAGADFADAIHLVAARGCASFVTFDRGVPDAPALGVTVERIG